MQLILPATTADRQSAAAMVTRATETGIEIGTGIRIETETGTETGTEAGIEIGIGIETLIRTETGGETVSFQALKREEYM